MPQTLMLLRGHSLRECFCLHLEQNIDSTFSSSTCFFFPYKTSNREDNERIISIFKFSHKLPLLALVTSSLVEFTILVEDLGALTLFLEDPHEYLQQSVMMSSNGSFEMSPFPIKFSIPKQSSLIA